MKFYRAGNLNAPVILLLPGTCCHWQKNFGEVIPLLEQDFHVVCVSYDGFDETEDTIFPDMLTETEKIEQYITRHFGGHICAAYGCSLGGSFVGLLVQRGNIHIDHAILGSSDLDQDSSWKAKLKCAVAIPLLYKIIHYDDHRGFDRFGGFCDSDRSAGKRKNHSAEILYCVFSFDGCLRGSSY